MIDASHTRNVIPAVCEVTVDCRLLPGRPRSEVEPKSCAVLGEGDYELEWIEARRRHPLADGTPTVGRDRGFVAEAEPGRARSAPICVAGFTDSHWMRDAFGTVAYGFFPMRDMDPAGRDPACPLG